MNTADVTHIKSIKNVCRFGDNLSSQWLLAATAHDMHTSDDDGIWCDKSVRTTVILFFLLWWQTSPDAFIPKHRSNDLKAISRVIEEAQHFIYISSIDYLPLLSRSAHRLETLSSSLWQQHTTVDALQWLQWLKSVCARAPHPAASPHFCICAKVLVSNRQPHPGGSDTEEGPGASADKLLGKDGASFL